MFLERFDQAEDEGCDTVSQVSSHLSLIHAWTSVVSAIQTHLTLQLMSLNSLGTLCARFGEFPTCS